MTGVEDDRTRMNQGSHSTLVLQGNEVYGALLFHSLLFILIVLLYRWAFVHGSKQPIESFGVEHLASFLFVSALFIVLLYNYAKAVLILLFSAKRVVKEGDRILVERVLGHWRGPVEELRLRKASLGWLVTLGNARYQLVLANGRVVADIIWLRNLLDEGIKPRRSLEENVALLRQWIQEAEEGEGNFFGEIRTGARNLLKDQLSAFVQRWPWVGKILWWSQVIGGYGAVLVALLIFSELSWVSLSALAMIIVEAFVVLCLLGAVRAGKDVRRGMESAFKFLQAVIGVLVVSVAWDWLGATHGYVGLVVLVGMLQGMAIAVEWAVPGAVFLAFSRGKNA